MQRPPRAPDQPLFGSRHLVLSLLQGFSIMVIVLAVFLVARDLMGKSIDESRALMFSTLIVANLCLIVVNRSWTRSALASLRIPNAAQWWVAGGGVVFLLLTLNIPFLRGLFKFEVLHANDLLVCLAAGIFSLLWFEGFKFVQGQRTMAAHGGASGA